ncbi:MAG: 23S rRNA (guanine745-N1)-methyltransferase [Paraglaciecola sp.]|jgi:23S rRNA (guanine745-N1)-methyltransferase
MWICPSCQLPLSLLEHSWSCDNGHRYDQAKEAYVNLLLAQHKRSKEPGDNKQMVNARRAFLQEGHYQPLANRLASLITEHQVAEELNVFDAGCGEGYYLHCIAGSLKAKNINVHAAGIDISKIAVQKAAKRYTENSFAVASSYKLPLADKSQDVIIQIFAPSGDTEIKRVLNQQGIWVQVNPAAQHLQQLKQALYDRPLQHKAQDNVPEGFVLLNEETLSFELQLDNPQQRMNLLMMTPFYWSAQQTKVDKMLATMRNARVDFSIRILQQTDPIIKPTPGMV